MFFPTLLSVLAVAAPALALPGLKFTGCDLSRAKLALPTNQTALVAPTTAPSFVALGVGVQNYTCTDASVFA